MQSLLGRVTTDLLAPAVCICAGAELDRGGVTQGGACRSPPLPPRPVSVPGPATRGGREAAWPRFPAGPISQSVSFPGPAPAWLLLALQVGETLRFRFPDSLWLTCSTSLPQAIPANMFAKAFRVRSNTAIKGSDR